MAQKVTADLVSRFMSENTRDRTTQSVLTTQFLKDQLESAKKELDTIDDKITKFRSENFGRLPEQLGNNQILLNGAESRIANLNSAISRVNQEKMLLETELRAQQTALESLTPSQEQLAIQAKSQKMMQVEGEITQIENTLAAMKERYKDTHPDVRALEAQLARVKRNKEQLLKAEEQ